MKRPTRIIKPNWGHLTKRKKSYAKDLEAKLHRLQSIVFETVK